jgi:hypothetical protein
MKMILSQKRAHIIDRLKENPNARAVARQVGGVTHTTVGTIARQEGIALTAGRTVRRMSPEKSAQILNRLKENPNTREVAAEVGGVSHQTVWRIAKQAGLELTAGPKKGVRMRPEQYAQIIGALEANRNASAVARQVGGVTRATVWKIAKQAGLELPRRKSAGGNRAPKSDTRIKVGKATRDNALASGAPPTTLHNS